jgi:hypothetical protein
MSDLKWIQERLKNKKMDIDITSMEKFEHKGFQKNLGVMELKVCTYLPFLVKVETWNKI